jgi:zinc protease
VRNAGLIVTSLALAACTALSPPDRAGSGLPTEDSFLRKTLDNGLKVVLVEDHAAPVVALNVWVRVGSADEHADEAGMAHVFEHMLFKGTERRAVGEIARTVEAAGGMINAFTSFDMTVYHITMASRDVATGIDVLADAVRFSTFDPDELAKETEVVVEEINRGEDSPGRVLSQAVFDLAFENHPYRLPVIGTEDSVRSFSREQILEFHSRWYIPNNMTFVAVGDFDSEAVLDQVRAAFGEAVPRDDLAHPRAAEGAQTAPRAAVVRRDFEQTQLGIAFPITRFEDPETAVLDLLSAVLGGGDSSRLYRDVKDRAGLVHAIGTSSYTPLDPGLLFVDATLESDKVEPALEAIAVQIERLRRFGPTETELERARINLLSHEVREKETVQGQARKFGYYETLARGLEAEAAYLKRVRSATSEDLRLAAQKYLRLETANVAVLVPTAERTELTEGRLLAALASPSAAEHAWTVEELAGGVRLYRLANGLRVVVKPNHTVPLVAMRLSFLGGLLAETDDTQGIAAFLSELLEKGTEQRSAAQIAAEVEGMAGSLAGFSGRNTFGITAEFLTDSLDPGLELFTDVLLHPAFAPEEIDKLRVETLAALKRREDQLAQKAFELFSEGLYPGHPYRYPTLGTEKSVQDFDRDKLQTVWQRYAQPSNGVLSIVGDVDPDSVVEAIATRLSDWRGPAHVELPARSQPPVPDGPREVSVEKGRQQVHIVMGFPGIALGDPDGPALDVLTQVLSGQGGRLFVELRDKRSLAYSVAAFAIEGVDPGSFGVYIASSPDKLEESLEGLRSELARLLDEPIAPEEIERAKAYLIGSNAVSLQRYSAQAGLLSLDELYGMGATHYLGYAQRTEAVTAEDLKRVSQRLIRLNSPLVAIVR